MTVFVEVTRLYRTYFSKKITTNSKCFKVYMYVSNFTPEIRFNTVPLPSTFCSILKPFTFYQARDDESINLNTK